MLLTTPETIGRQRWNDFVTEHPHATVFQMPEMYDHYTNVKSYSPLVFALEGENGKLSAILLAVIIRGYKGIAGTLSARCVVYGGPLIDPKHINPAELIEQLLTALSEKVKRQSLYIQFRNFTDQSSFLPVFAKSGFSFQGHLNLVVDTSNENETLAAISKSKIRQAKRTTYSGAELVEAKNEDEILAFYSILKKVYKNKVRKPLPPLAFFLSFYNATKQNQLGLILIAKYKGIVVGGMLCPLTPGKSLSEWYVCGLDKEYREIHPSVFLTYGAIEYALRNNIPSFDFMGIGSPDKPYGVRDFKIRFGGEIVNYGRFQRINSPLLYPIAKSGFGVLSFLRLV
jgi:lipid II:glycine glycyltransferase (peptidoglycan interpeptide bridge formation enzyme)